MIQDIFNTTIPSKINVIRGDKAQISFSHDNDLLQLIVNNYTINYTQNIAMQRTLSDPEAIILLKRFADPGTVSIASLTGSVDDIRKFATKYGDVCTKKNAITWKLTTAGTDCDSDDLKLVTHNCLLLNVDLSGNAQNPFIGDTLTLQFFGLELK